MTKLYGHPEMGRTGLIASGSGFSLWGRYFGQVPTIYYPARKRVSLHDNPDLEIEWQKGYHLADGFVAAAAHRIGVLSVPQHQFTVRA